MNPHQLSRALEQVLSAHEGLSAANLLVCNDAFVSALPPPTHHPTIGLLSESKPMIQPLATNLPPKTGTPAAAAAAAAATERLHLNPLLPCRSTTRKGLTP